MKINTGKCTIISRLSKPELDLFLQRAKNENLAFRSRLNFPTLYSFGNEVEFNCFFSNYVGEFVSNFNDRNYLYEDDQYEMRKEATASGEIVTPILTNEQYHWKVFKDLFDSLVFDGATVSDNTASHIHIGTHMINTPHELALLIKALVVFEPIIFRFGYGLGEEPRSFIKADHGYVNYAMFSTPRKVKRFVEVLENFDPTKSKEMMMYEFIAFTTIGYRHRTAFNFNKFDFRKMFAKVQRNQPYYNDNIEIRCFNGTLWPEVVQNNINLIVSLLRAVHEGRLDEVYIEREYLLYIKNDYDFDHGTSVLYDYEEIDEYNKVLAGFNKVNMEKAMKLADMIFDDDKDKLLFMKQYLKLFKVNEKEVTMSL